MQGSCHARVPPPTLTVPSLMVSVHKLELARLGN